MKTVLMRKKRKSMVGREGPERKRQRKEVELKSVRVSPSSPFRIKSVVGSSPLHTALSPATFGEYLVPLSPASHT